MKLPNVKTIDDLETIKVLADERRLALLRMLAKSQTVKELSTALDLPQSQLYYHVNLLEKHGLIQVVDTKVISGIIEKHYRTTAHQFRIRNPMLMGSSITNAETTAIFSSFLDETKEEMQEAFRKAPPRTTDEPPLHPFISRKSVRLTHDQLVQFHAKLDALIKECDIRWEENVDTEAEEYSLLVAFFQADSGDKENDHGS
ncbi:MAG: helix-turn-helix transcriptional regulator [Caldilineaceae bacterium]|nr:helix-turn-helix transcriptional regulator [Caldilineaceae bacterium]